MHRCYHRALNRQLQSIIHNNRYNRSNDPATSYHRQSLPHHPPEDHPPSLSTIFLLLCEWQKGKTGKQHAPPAEITTRGNKRRSSLRGANPKGVENEARVRNAKEEKKNGNNKRTSPAISRPIPSRLHLFVPVSQHPRGQLRMRLKVQVALVTLLPTDRKITKRACPKWKQIARCLPRTSCRTGYGLVPRPFEFRVIGWLPQPRELLHP